MAAPLLDSRPDELEEIWRWRWRCFRELGFGWREAEELAAGDADLHRMADLIAAGCPRELALQILS